jgi:hypothetical protein
VPRRAERAGPPGTATVGRGSPAVGDSSRLGEARDALGRRLTRRGIAWSAAVSAILLENAVGYRLHIQLSQDDLASHNFDRIALRWVDFD